MSRRNPPGAPSPSSSSYCTLSSAAHTGTAALPSIEAAEAGVSCPLMDGIYTRVDTSDHNGKT